MMLLPDPNRTGPTRPILLRRLLNGRESASVDQHVFQIARVALVSPPRTLSRLTPLQTVELGQCTYDDAYAVQVSCVESVVNARTLGGHAGVIHLVEHVPPVITISRRAGASDHLLASPQLLAHHGISLRETDRGGDITYHGPGQLVIYPILDLNIFHLGIHDYMRLLEEAVILLCASYGIQAARDAAATGVWVGDAKLCAMGVRLRKWVSMHGLAINVTTNLDHFKLIVPCGLAGRPVTSLATLLGNRCPSFEQVKADLAHQLRSLLLARLDGAS